MMSIPQVFINGVKTELCESLVGDMMDVLMSCSKFDCLSLSQNPKETCIFDILIFIFKSFTY